MRLSPSSWFGSSVLFVALSAAHLACGGAAQTQKDEAAQKDADPGGPAPASPTPVGDCDDCGPATCWVNPDAPECPQAKTCYVRFEAGAERIEGTDTGGTDSDGGPIALTVSLDTLKPERNPAFAPAVPACDGCVVAEKAISDRKARLVLGGIADQATVDLRFACSVNAGTFRVAIHRRSFGVEVEPISVTEDE